MHEQSRLVYHAVPASTLRRCIGRNGYEPPSLADQGFVHCTAAPELVLQVAQDYYAGVTEPLVLLAIDPERLTAPLRFEAPAPIAGGGTRHLASGALFPHLYGALNLDAVVGAAALRRDGASFVWPETFGSLGAWLGWSVWRCDDHGNEFEVARDLDEREARRLVAEYDERGHKQSYRASPTRTDDAR